MAKCGGRRSERTNKHTESQDCQLVSSGVGSKGKYVIEGLVYNEEKRWSKAKSKEEAGRVPREDLTDRDWICWETQHETRSQRKEYHRRKGKEIGWGQERRKRGFGRLEPALQLRGERERLPVSFVLPPGPLAGWPILLWQS